MDREEFQKAYGKLVAKAWADEEFKAKLLADPMAVFKENDITIPAGLEVKIVENTDKIAHMILPPAPAGELKDEQLKAANESKCLSCDQCLACTGCQAEFF